MGEKRVAGAILNHFRQLLSRICERPAMFVGHSSLVDVATYLSGYCHGLEDCAQPLPFLGTFQRWAEMRFGIRHTAWNWTRILLHEFGTDEAALRELPRLYDEFTRDFERLGIDGIISEATKGLITNHGADWWEPPTTHTLPRAFHERRQG